MSELEGDPISNNTFTELTLKRFTIYACLYICVVSIIVALLFYIVQSSTDFRELITRLIDISYLIAGNNVQQRKQGNASTG